MSSTIYSSLGGADINAVIGNVKFGNVQMISYSIERKKGFIHSIGSTNAKAIGRGIRTVQGALIFSLIDHDSLVKALNPNNSNGIFLSNEELINATNTANNGVTGTSSKQQQAFRAGGSLSQTGVIGSNTFSSTVETSIFKPSNFGKENTQAYLSDQLLPFDITGVGIPEYGAQFAKRFIIRGVELMTESSGTSINDLSIEKQHTFIARTVDDWVSLADLDQSTGTGNVVWS